MLTKSDVKTIGDLFDKKFDEKFDKKFKDGFDLAFEKHTKSIKEDVSQIRHDQKLIIKFFDREYLDLRKRVERIESHLKLSNIN